MKLLREDICFIISYELYLQITERTELRRKIPRIQSGKFEYYVYICNIYNILNGKTNLTQFNQPEHAGLCLAGEMLIGAYIVCHYARTSLEASSDAATSKASPANWEIDALQEKWFSNGQKPKDAGFPMQSRTLNQNTAQ